MKKVLSLTIACMLLLGALGICAYAEEAPLSADVYVNIADKGELVVSYEKITVTDIDNDNKLTINDALYCAHEAKYTGGATVGYASENSDWGLSLNKLWGDTSGAFGYYVNNASAWSLADTVKSGDCITAFVYKDVTTWSDKYSYFNNAEVSVQSGDEITLTLTASYYDYTAGDGGATVTVPLENATVTVDGSRTEYKTDAEGKVTLKLTEGGNHVISAVSDSMILVPPVCIAKVTAPVTEPVTEPVTDTANNTEATAADDTQPEGKEDENSGCKSSIAVMGIAVATVAAVAATVSAKRKNED